MALNILSALTGSLSIILVFTIAKKMFGEREGVLAGTLFAILPISLMMSVSPLTNMPGLFSLLIFIYFAFVHSKNIVLVSIIAGLILGMRATEAPIILGILALTYLRKSFKKFLISLCFFIIGVLLWLIPTVLITGTRGFIDSYSWIAHYVISHDSVLNSNFLSRIERIYYLLDVSYTLPFILVGTVSFFFILAKMLDFKEFRFRLLVVWFLGYLIPLIFVYNLEVPRYTLPLAAPVVIMTSHTILIFSKKLNRKIVIGLVTIFSLAMFKKGLEQLKMFKVLTPPTIALVNYVNKNFSTKDVIVISSFTFRHFQYYAPGFKNYLSGPGNAPTKIESTYLIIDYIGIKDKIENRNEYELIEQKTFEGPKEIFPRVSKTNLIVLERKGN